MLSEIEIAVMQQVCRSACWSVARRWPGGHHLIEDCIQEVLLKVWGGIKRRSLRGAEVAPYTRTTAFYEARHFFRKHCVPRVSLDACAEPQDAGENNPLLQLEHREETNRFQAALQQLPPDQREALEVVAGSRNHNQAAETLAKHWGCKRHKVYYLRSLAIKAIRKHLGSEPEEGSHAN